LRLGRVLGYSSRFDWQLADLLASEPKPAKRNFQKSRQPPLHLNAIGESPEDQRKAAGWVHGFASPSIAFISPRFQPVREVLQVLGNRAGSLGQANLAWRRSFKTMGDKF
jgi:hypothetical protein